MSKFSSRAAYLVASLLVIAFLLITAHSTNQADLSQYVPKKFSHIASSKPEGTSFVDNKPKLASNYQRENATFVTLARNEELRKLLPVIMNLEDRFNSKYHYDWVFLNNEEFTEEFVEQVSALVSGRARFGTIAHEHWSYPDFINQTKAAEYRAHAKNKIKYGAMESYHHMCRFESGMFFKNEIMQEYRYYWRVEPETTLFCDIDYDLFKYMRENDKTYGFVVALKEFRDTVPTLWKSVKGFIEKFPQYIHPNNLEAFVTELGERKDYNLCHFWTNFEIADADFWRGEAYQAFFDHLDRDGGFFYERWGDAPVHSIAVSMLLPREKLHFFDDVGYFHHPHTRCPAFQKARNLRCACLQQNSFDWHKDSCLRYYYKAWNQGYPDDYKELEK